MNAQLEEVAGRRLGLVMLAVICERARQDELVVDGKLPFNCATPGVPGIEKFVVLSEEFGEVAQALHNRDHLGGINRKDRVKTDLRKELIQLAAVAVAWLESMPFEKELVTDYVIIRILRRQLMFVDRVGGWTRNPTQAAHYSVLSEAKQARPHKVGTVALWKNIPRIVKSRGLIVMGPLTNREWGQR